MKIISDLYKPICEVWCRGCLDDHTIDFLIGRDNSLYVRMSDTGYSLFTRIKQSFRFLFSWKDYVSGDAINAYSILLSEEQIKDLHDTLLDSFSHLDFSNYELEIKHINEVDGDVESVFFDQQSLVVSCIGLETYTIGTRLPDYTKFKDALRMFWGNIKQNGFNFISGNDEAILEEQNVINLIKALEHISS
jgi:hypothetical protein